MEKQSLKTASRRWLRGHIFLWMVYAILAALVLPNLIDHPDFENWPLTARILVALLPVFPVAIWLYVAGRFVAHSPDEFGANNNIKATATAGAVTALALFTAGWIEVTLNTGPVSSWWFVPLFGVTWTIQLLRLQQDGAE